MRSSFGFALGPGDCPRSRKLGTGRQRMRLSEVGSALKLRSQSGGVGLRPSGQEISGLKRGLLDESVLRGCARPASLERKHEQWFVCGFRSRAGKESDLSVDVAWLRESR